MQRVRSDFRLDAASQRDGTPSLRYGGCALSQPMPIRDRMGRPLAYGDAPECHSSRPIIGAVTSERCNGGFAQPLESAFNGRE